MKNIAIILASGTGSRFSNEQPKQFYEIDNKTVLARSIEAFNNNKNIDEIIVVSNPDYIIKTTQIAYEYSKVINVIIGGETRQQSSYNGVFSVTDKKCNVLIHDAARPFVSQKIINDCINALSKYKAVNVAIDSSDTIIEVDKKNIIKSVPDRKSIKRCQTPQCFEISIIKNAHTLAKQDNDFTATDDCSLVFKYHLTDIYVVSGDTKNIKITYPEDVIVNN